jgi:nucleotide-binding universal stress UspA family protein
MNANLRTAIGIPSRAKRPLGAFRKSATTMLSSVASDPLYDQLVGSVRPLGGFMIRKILAPTDLSKLSLAGVRHALTMARELDAEVIIYHVVTGNEIAKLRRPREKTVADFAGVIAAYEMRLASFVEQNCADIIPLGKVSQKVEFGTTEKSIVKTAKTEGVDLIIMATYGRRGLSRMLSGSVTEQVIRNGPCLVLAIPPHLTAVGQRSALPLHSERRVSPQKKAGRFR